jgi:hypothetical protein
MSTMSMPCTASIASRFSMPFRPSTWTITRAWLAFRKYADRSRLDYFAARTKRHTPRFPPRGVFRRLYDVPCLLRTLDIRNLDPHGSDIESFGNRDLAGIRHPLVHESVPGTSRGKRRCEFIRESTGLRPIYQMKSVPRKIGCICWWLSIRSISASEGRDPAPPAASSTWGRR